LFYFLNLIFICLTGDTGLRRATQVALLNANYMLKRLEGHYSILFTDKNGLCAHEFILDTRVFGPSSGVEAIDIAKRLHVCFQTLLFSFLLFYLNISSKLLFP
jgi:glycine cleavage system protein P-like pyridoxal-binding family